MCRKNAVKGSDYCRKHYEFDGLDYGRCESCNGPVNGMDVLCDACWDQEQDLAS